MTSQPEKHRITHIAEALQAHGHRLTEPRQALIEVLVGSEQHLDHAEILARAQQRIPQLGRATVYRTLELLTGLGLIHATYLGDGRQRFCVPSGGHHHHLICNHCGTVTDLDHCLLDDGLERFAQQHDFTVESHLVELYGICHDCQKAA
ncbi:MAG: transcriptional repressor [Anaerolineales bacterium]|nr:transcriptional repressor [Anaerolineales bacterium]MCB9128189.1 transcriptional repressor [Ardenticatenales bacterium]